MNHKQSNLRGIQMENDSFKAQVIVYTYVYQI